MKPLVTALLGAIEVVERFAIRLALVMLFAVMMIVAADVFMRYVFNAPFSWAYDLISLYLMAGAFFLGQGFGGATDDAEALTCVVERIVDLVDQAGAEASEGGELLVLHEHGFGLLDLLQRIFELLFLHYELLLEQARIDEIFQAHHDFRQ